MGKGQEGAVRNNPGDLAFAPGKMLGPFTELGNKARKTSRLAGVLLECGAALAVGISTQGQVGEDLGAMGASSQASGLVGVCRTLKEEVENFWVGLHRWWWKWGRRCWRPRPAGAWLEGLTGGF